VCGVLNPQRQLDTRFKHTKSSFLFEDIIHHVDYTMEELIWINRANNEQTDIPESSWQVSYSEVHGYTSNI
jgi:hypothetical protein